MARHLVGQLDRKARLMLRDEIVSRLQVAQAAIDALPAIPEDRANGRLRMMERCVVEACLAGFGFAVEEVRNLQATQKVNERAKGGA